MQHIFNLSYELIPVWTLQNYLGRIKISLGSITNQIIIPFFSSEFFEIFSFLEIKDIKCKLPWVYVWSSAYIK